MEETLIYPRYQIHLGENVSQKQKQKIRLHEYKAKYIAKLGTYKPKNDREKQLVNHIVVKLHNLRRMTLADLLFDAYLIVSGENVSDELKSILLDMMEESQLIEGE